MSLFPFFKKKEHFSEEEKAKIVNAIRHAEQQTSGEVRVYVESRNPLMDPVERAATLFFKLKMDKTDHRNGVLLYVAVKDKEIALFGDEGIYKATGKPFWDNAVRNMISHITVDDFCAGMVTCIHTVGETLKEKFPYIKSEDKNELPDDIIFGR